MAKDETTSYILGSVSLRRNIIAPPKLPDVIRDEHLYGALPVDVHFRKMSQLLLIDSIRRATGL
jgi:hypothetical protein